MRTIGNRTSAPMVLCPMMVGSRSRNRLTVFLRFKSLRFIVSKHLSQIVWVKTLS